MTVLCKPDKYYNVPNNWPVCKAKCPSEKPIPSNETRMELWVDHPKMKGTKIFKNINIYFTLRFRLVNTIYTKLKTCVV